MNIFVVVIELGGKGGGEEQAPQMLHWLRYEYILCEEASLGSTNAALPQVHAVWRSIVVIILMSDVKLSFLVENWSGRLENCPLPSTPTPTLSYPLLFNAL